MLREGRFILPLQTNDGRSVGPVIHETALKLTDEFGGATITEARGLWKSEDGTVMNEAIFTLDVAYEPSQANDQRLIAIATRAAMQAAQKSVYIRLASGEVLIPDVQAHVLQEAA